jgi:adenylate kinase family enzyme
MTRTDAAAGADDTAGSDDAVGADGVDGRASYRRVLVAGASGAGKSTMAGELARRLDLPYTELDSLYHGPSWTPREAFVDDVTAIALSDAWVSEWQYRSVRPLLLARAELLVVLDYSRAIVTGRVVLRTVRRRLRRIELWNGNREPAFRTFFTDPEHIVRWSWSSFARNRSTTRALVADPPPGLEVVHLSSPRAARRWMRRLAE